MRPMLVTSGEPTGIGLDICLALANQPFPVVILADKDLLQQRAKMLKMNITLVDYVSHNRIQVEENTLTVLSIPCKGSVIPGKLNALHASYVIQMLSIACEKTLSGEFSALITAPVHKAILNDAGYSFTGHTEFLKQFCNATEVVMMLAGPTLKVALATTHLPLSQVSTAITSDLLLGIIRILNQALMERFGMTHPKIAVAGLNPHAGESGYLGDEEIKIISPSLKKLQQEGILVDGPFPADTMYSIENRAYYDVFLTMYHDQGLPVIKFVDFEEAVNVTLGLPIIRTSVDHGTAQSLAGTGKANPSSLVAAVQMAYQMAQQVNKHANH